MKSEQKSRQSQDQCVYEQRRLGTKVLQVHKRIPSSQVAWYLDYYSVLPKKIAWNITHPSSSLHAMLRILLFPTNCPNSRRDCLTRPGGVQLTDLS